MNDPILELTCRAVEMRLRSEEERLRKLLDAGVPPERLTLLVDRRCRCQGTGIVTENDGVSITMRECADCLGVAMVEEVRTPEGLWRRISPWVCTERAGFPATLTRNSPPLADI